MTAFNLVDCYRGAGLTPTPEVLGLRQEPFNKLRKALDFKSATGLARLYFDMAVPQGTDWFRDPFHEADASFSLVDNAREVAVLASALLEAALADGKIYAGLAILTTYAAGLRKPIVRVELVDSVRYAIEAKAAATRDAAPVDVKRIQLPAASKSTSELAALIQNPEIGKASTLLKQVSDESYEITKGLTNSVFSVASAMAQQIQALREESEILWWHIGGWSRLLEKPLVDFDLGTAAVLAGIDMAELSRSTIGPAAAPAVLQRTLLAGRRVKISSVSIKDAVDGLSKAELTKLGFLKGIGPVADICPLLTAFAKAQETGGGAAWHASFSTVTNLDPNAGMSPLELALQAHRERLFIKSMS